MLTQREIDTVKADWGSVRPIAAQAATLFYDRLFELDPSLRSMFAPSLAAQKKKLVQMLGAAVAGLDDLPKLVPVVEALGRRHVGYGVQPEHYGTVGLALLWTLEQGLGDGFDRSHKAAWKKVYGVLAGTMQTAAAAESPAKKKTRAPKRAAARKAGATKASAKKSAATAKKARKPAPRR